MKFNPAFLRSVVALTLTIVAAGSLLAWGSTNDVPVGSIEGVCLAQESGKPIANATVILRPRFKDKDYDLRYVAVKTDSQGRFFMRSVTSGVYSVEAFSRVHSVYGEAAYVQEGKRSQLKLTLSPTEAYLSVYASQHVFAPKEQAVIQVRGFSPAQRLSVSVFPISFDKIVAARGLYEVLSPMANADATLQNRNLGPPTSQFEWPIKTRDAEGVFNERVRFEAFQEGFYWVQITAADPSGNVPNKANSELPANRKGFYLVVSKIALVAKTERSRTNAYVVDIESGAPIPNAVVKLYSDVGAIGDAQTNRSGLASLALPKSNPDQEESASRRALVATVGASRAIVAVNGYGEGRPPAKIYLTTDRTVYRPGDLIQFRGTIRLETQGMYRLPGQGTADLELRDEADTLIAPKTAKVDARGAFSESFQLGPEDAGNFQIVSTFQGTKEIRYISVAAYRKPEVKVTVTPEQPFYIRGQKVRMRVHCEYYFGGPAIGVKVNATVYRRADYFGPSFGDEEDFDESEYESGYVGDYAGEVGKDAKTDERGDVILEFDPSAKSGSDPPARINSLDELPSDETLTFEVTVRETEERTYDGQGSVSLLRGSFSVTAQQDKYIVAPGEPLTVDIKTTENGGATKAGVPLTVETGYQEWDQRKSRFIRDATQTVATDRSGQARLTLRPNRPGEFVARISAVDAQGNRITSEVWVWSFREGSALGGSEPKLQIVLDKKQYKAGETAMAVVRSDKPGGYAWITVESDTVQSSRVVLLKSATTTVPIPVTGDMAPNVYVAASYVRDKRFSETQRRISVGLDQHTLNVRVTPDRSVVAPGDVVRYTIQTTRPDGTPVPASFALAVVDESIFAIREDREDPLAEFYPRRYNGVETTYSFPELYLDGGDKSPVNIEVRQKFKDTAFWMPQGETGQDGLAQVTVKLPDNVTGWRATVTAFSDQTECGKARTVIQARKELMVRVAAPQYLTEGDSLNFSALVTNDSSKEAQVNVQIVTQGLPIEGSPSRRITVGAARTVPVTWVAKPNRMGEAVITLKAWIEGGPSDGVEQKLKVLPRGRWTTSYVSGEVSGERAFTIQRAQNADTGVLEIRVQPSLADALLSSLETLVDYPYGCTEQTMSRFIPAVMVRAALRRIGRSDPGLDAKIVEVARRSRNRLKELQHEDGSFGWWESDKGDLAMTALVLEGLWRAKQTGLIVDQWVVDKALGWSVKQLEDNLPLTEAERKDPSLAALARSTRVNLVYSVGLWKGKSEAAKYLDPALLAQFNANGLAFYAMATEDTKESNRALTLLLNMATKGENSYYWPSPYGLEYTARALQALLELRPDAPAIVKILDYVWRSQRTSGWVSTRDTAILLEALSGRVTSSDAAQSAGPGRLYVNGKMIGTFEQRRTARFGLAVADLRPGPNEVRLVTGAGGRALFTATVRQLARSSSLSPIDSSGIRVTRTFHTLTAVTDSYGSTRLDIEPRAATSFTSGQPVRCVVTVEAARAHQYVQIEVPVPAGLQIVETENPETWNWWWSSMRILEDRVVQFASYLPAGKSTFEFNLSAEAPGMSGALPADVFEMYSPDVRGSSAEERIEVIAK